MGCFLEEELAEFLPGELLSGPVMPDLQSASSSECSNSFTFNYLGYLALAVVQTCAANECW